MADATSTRSQTMAQKKNYGVVQALGKQLEQLQKDKKKNLQSVDQEALDIHKFLEQITCSTGNSVTYEEVFPDHKKGHKRMGESSSDKYRPTRSSVVRMEVQLRKSLAEARYKARSEDFFRRWKQAFERDLYLDDWLAGEKSEIMETKSVRF